MVHCLSDAPWYTAYLMPICATLSIAHGCTALCFLITVPHYQCTTLSIAYYYLTLPDEPVAPGMVNASSTPLLSLGFYDDWRDGMEQYARMQKDADGNPQGEPVPLPGALNLTSAPIAGWNGWAMSVQSAGDTNLTTLFAASDTLEKLKPKGWGPNSIVARDAIYGLNQSQTAVWVNHVKGHQGQLAGTYASLAAAYGDPATKSPYVDCGDNPCATPGPACWVRNDTILKTDKGVFIHSLSQPNQYVRDVSHPVFACFVKQQIEEIIGRDKFTLIKQDFMNLAAYEGIRYNMTMCPTGMSAYNRLLKLLAEAVSNRAVIDYGISLPLPVGKVGHSRHIGCEQMFGGIEYGMNQFAGGWWQNQLYTWLDPDLITFEGRFSLRPDVSLLCSLCITCASLSPCHTITCIYDYTSLSSHLSGEALIGLHCR